LKTQWLPGTMHVSQCTNAVHGKHRPSQLLGVRVAVLHTSSAQTLKPDMYPHMILDGPLPL
jgi:hypothetical protein